MRKLFIRICTIVLGVTTLITLSGCESTTPVTSSQESSAIADEVASADISAIDVYKRQGNGWRGLYWQPLGGQVIG